MGRTMPDVWAAIAAVDPVRYTFVGRTCCDEQGEECVFCGEWNACEGKPIDHAESCLWLEAVAEVVD